MAAWTPSRPFIATSSSICGRRFSSAWTRLMLLSSSSM
jgi:hypothetical protein